jgi:glycerophosphoryl diester phosphodiesterase
MADIIHSNCHYDFTSQIYLAIWSLDFLERARKVLPEFQVSYTGEYIHEARKDFFDKVESYNMCYSSILSDKTEFVNLIKRKGRKLFVWTVDDTNDIKECIEFGKIDGILSDNPVECIRVRRDVIRRRKFLISNY